MYWVSGETPGKVQTEEALQVRVSSGGEGQGQAVEGSSNFCSVALSHDGQARG